MKKHQNWGFGCAVSALSILAGACQLHAQNISLSGSPSHREQLNKLVLASPLPPGWTLTDDAGVNLVLSLDSDSEKTAANSDELALPAGKTWEVPALPLDDPRFAISLAEANGMTLVPLEDLLPPLRTPKVDGLWPGQAGYPLEKPLYLKLQSRQGQIPEALRSWLGTGAASLMQSGNSPHVLAAVGDLESGAAGSAFLLSGEKGFSRLLSPELIKAMRGSDILVANLEGQITQRGRPDPSKHYRFRFPPGIGAAYRSLGCDLVLLGNNHSMDFGQEGLVDTMSDLDKAGLPYVGAGSSDAAASEAKEAACPASRGIVFVGLACFPPEAMGFNKEKAAATATDPGILADVDRCVQRIQSERKAGNMVVVLVHGGTEFTESPDSRTKAIFRRLADAGAALVIGSHPHVLQGVEGYKDSLIAYSLGNFLFADREMPDLAQPTAIMSFLVYQGKVRALDILPARASASGTFIDPDPRTALKLFLRRCAMLRVKE